MSAQENSPALHTNLATGEPILPDAHELAETARADLTDLGEEMKQQAASLGEEALSQLDSATQQAKSMAAEQKDLLAEQLGGVSDALQKVADELDTGNESSARYVRLLADGAKQITSTVRDNDVDAILAIAQDFGRRQPVAFMGAAALLGFVASRFVLASATRPDRHESDITRPPYSSYRSGVDDNSPTYEQYTGGDDAGL